MCILSYVKLIIPVCRPLLYTPTSTRTSVKLWKCTHRTNPNPDRFHKKSQDKLAEEGAHGLWELSTNHEHAQEFESDDISALVEVLRQRTPEVSTRKT